LAATFHWPTPPIQESSMACAPALVQWESIVHASNEKIIAEPTPVVLFIQFSP
jgi:hypothetical protein